MTPTDLQLLLATHRGHGPAAEALWARLSPRMHAHARSILRSDDAAADVVQAVFLSVLARRRAELRQVRDVTAWLLMLTRNAALNQIRASRRQRTRDAAARPRSTPCVSPPDALPLQAALDRLPRRDREIIVLKHAAGLTFDQIALALQINRSTAASRYRSAIERLRRFVTSSPQQPAGCTHG